ncbi:mitochondrial inner membrane translocase subunit Tim17/Tim22/Tim23/peroxisomal protein PMP24 [Echria macrotheca]|uniref:Mitochondrial import inner membrane translocase subunit TIM22 n=1 Tax=Echria macrotheca TaxID=438768 RepID=A0AAJ0BQ18_9PEZI|nr:mitochondrial inner membrane translocase subunit Tim17/Tim22/Tim23/peroxisomal protein PMP24 [Echria macrotheca]
MNFPGASGAGAGSPRFDPNDPNVKWLTNAMESCYAKTAMSGVAGFGLGGLFGLFMASMAYDTPYHTAGATAQPTSSLPWRQQVRIGFKDMGTRSWSTAKNFGMVGALFSGIECGIEGLRAKNDMANGVAAGCLTGAILARNGGPQAAAVGCAGFAAFSAAIDAWMRMPKEED